MSVQGKLAAIKARQASRKAARQSTAGTISEAIEDFIDTGDGVKFRDMVIKFTDEVYSEGLPDMFNFFRTFDFNSPQVESKIDFSRCFTKYTMIMTKKPMLIHKCLDEVILLIEFWAKTMTKQNTDPTSEQGENYGRAVRTLLLPFVNLSRKDDILAVRIIPTALLCLASRDADCMRFASSILSVVSMSHKDEIAVHIDTLLFVLDSNTTTTLDEANSSMLLNMLYQIYERCSDTININCDLILEYTTSRGTGGASMAGLILGKIAKKQPKLLYPYVKYFIPLLKDMRTSHSAMTALSDIAARNALVVKPFIQQIASAAADMQGGYYPGSAILGEWECVHAVFMCVRTGSSMVQIMVRLWFY